MLPTLWYSFVEPESESASELETESEHDRDRRTDSSDSVPHGGDGA